MTIRSDLSRMIEQRDGRPADEVSVEIIVYLCELDILDANVWLEDDPVMQARLDDLYPEFPEQQFRNSA